MSRYIQLIEFGFKNFFRYGSNWTVVKLEKGLMNIYGENGLGKSTCMEALHFNWFGETYRNINLDKMINKKNGKNLETYSVFNVIENGTTTQYKIRRGLKPKIEQIYKDNNEEPLKTDGKFSNYISEKILGFNSNTNKKIISVNPKVSSFVGSSLEDRRKVIDSIVNLTQTKEYLKLSKSALSEMFTKKTLIKAEIESIDKESNGYLLAINARKESTQSDIDLILSENTQINKELLEKNNKKDILLQNIKDEKEKISSLSLEKIELEKEYNKLDPATLNNQIIEANSNLKYLQTKAKEIKNEINKILPNVECSHCGNFYTVDQANVKRREKEASYHEIEVNGKAARKELNDLQSQVEIVNKAATKVNEKASEISEINSKVQDYNYEIRILDQHISLLNSNIKKNNEKMLSINEEKSKESSFVEIENKYNELKKKRIEIVKEAEEIDKKVDSLNYMIKMFSDDGIKNLVLKKFLPILNKLINYYLKTFNLNINFEITPDYNYTMTSNDVTGDEYDALSGGQQQRINLAILFAQTDLVKIIGNFKTNILFLDEYCDGAVDNKGLLDIFAILKKITDKDNKSIVLISHRLTDQIITYFDYFYYVRSTDNEYSELVESNLQEISKIIQDN